MVIMLPKAGKSPQPEGYRSITLLSAVAKLFEKLFLSLLQSHIHPRSEQFGKRVYHSGYTTPQQRSTERRVQ